MKAARSTFRGLAYRFQISREVDFGFIKKVNPASLKFVNQTPKFSTVAFFEGTSNQRHRPKSKRVTTECSGDVAN